MDISSILNKPILSDVFNKVDDYVGSARSVLNEKASDIKSRINDIPGLDIKDHLRAMSTGSMLTDMGFDGQVNEIIKNINEVKSLATKVSDIYNDVSSLLPQSRALNLSNVVSTGYSTAQRLMNEFLQNGAMSISGNSVVKTVGTAMSADYIRDQYGKDPMSNEIDLHTHIKAILEDQGYIANKFRAIKFSRDYIFIGNPVLESDISSPLYRSYAIWTRPDLNTIVMDDNTYYPSHELLFYPEFLQKTLVDMNLYSELCWQTCQKSEVFYLLSNYTKEISAVQIQDGDREGVKNMFGVESHLPGKPEFHMVDVTVTFTDNARGDIRKLFDYLSDYAYYNQMESYPAGAKYIRYNALNTLMSCYLITVDINDEIIGFAPIISMIPKSLVTDFAQHNREGFEKKDLLGEFSVTFTAQTFKAFRPSYFDQFNRITRFNKANLVDTKGSGHTLQYYARQDEAPKFNKDLNSSVFKANPTLLSKGFNPADTLNIFSLLEGSSYDLTAQSIIQPGDSNGAPSMQAVMPYKGVYEMIAKKPGVYVEYHPDEPNRPRFKLGFSY